MNNRFWATIPLLIHLFQDIIGTGDDLEFDLKLDLPNWTDIEESLNFDSQYFAPTEPALQVPGASQLHLSAQSSASHSAPNILLGSTFHDDPETSARKRAKIQVPFTPLNYIPSSRGPPTNAHSPTLKGPFAASTDPNCPMDQIEHGSGSVHSMMRFTTGVQCTQDYAAVSLLNQLFGSHQTVCTRKQNNLRPHVDLSDHPIRTSHAERLGLDEKYMPHIARTFDKKKPAKKVQQTTKRKNTDVHEANGSLNAYSASQPIPRDHVLLNEHHFNYFWIDFKPSTIDGKLVLELLGNVKLVDETYFLNFAAGLSHAQELDDTIQNKFPQKMFCLDSFSNSNEIGFFNFFNLMGRSRLPQIEAKERNKLGTKARQRFRWNPNDPSTISAHQTKIWEYRELVLSEFKQSIETFDKKVTSYPEGHTNSEAVQMFLKMRELLPMYLFYVDLISALVPVQPLDATGVLLKSERRIAGECFFELLQEALSHDQKWNLTNVGQNRGFPLVKKFKEGLQRSRNSHHQDSSIIWKAIEIWILTSRKNLAKVVDIHGVNFKAFFNHLVWSWAAEDKEFGKMVFN